MLRISILLMMMTWSAAGAQPPDAASAKQVFESLYARRIKQVSATVGKQDDIALAKEMLATAKTSTNTPALLALLCDAVFDAASRHPEGYATAVDAMTLLAETIPDKRTSAREKLTEVLARQSQAGSQKERDAAGERLMETFLLLGDARMEANKWNDAAGDYRRALATAVAMKSIRDDEIKSKLDTASWRERIDKQIEGLRERLLKDATDAASAEELVRIHVLDLGDAQSANPYLDRIKDAALRKLVALSMKPAAQLSEDECLQLAEWYVSQAAKSPAPAKAQLLHRAQGAFERFVSLHAQDDALKVKAQAQLKDVKKGLWDVQGPFQLVRTFRYLDYKNDSWNNDIADQVRVTRAADGVSISLDIKDGYREKLILFSESLRGKKVAGTITIKDGEVMLGWRPRDLAPRGLSAPSGLTKGRHAFEASMDGNQYRLSIDGKPVELVGNPSDMEWFALAPSRKAAFVIHGVQFAK